MLIVAATLPAFLFRLWRGWILVSNNDDGRCRVSTIGSLLWLTTFWAAAAACTQGVSLDAWMRNPDEQERVSELLVLTIIFSLPALLAGTALVLALRAVMIQRMRMAVSAAIVASALLLAIAEGGAILLVCLMYRNDANPLTAAGLLQAIVGVGSFCATALTIGFSAFVTLRAIGCRLLHAGEGKLVKTPSSLRPLVPELA
jgi:hypothetical protein